MQSSFECKFASIIAKRNSKTYTDLKVKSSFYFLFFVGFVLGIATFFIGIRESAFVSGQQISDHVSSVFSDCETIADHFIGVLKISETDLSHIFFIFISGFTYFCFAVSGAIVFAKGFSFGFSALFLLEVKEQLAFSGVHSFVCAFILLEFAVCAVAISLAAETYIFSYEFRSIKQNLSVLKRAPVTYRFIFTFAKSIGGTLIINFIYCAAVTLL